jgi:hypothetical protein
MGTGGVLEREAAGDKSTGRSVVGSDGRWLRSGLRGSVGGEGKGRLAAARRGPLARKRHLGQCLRPDEKTQTGSSMLGPLYELPNRELRSRR